MRRGLRCASLVLLFATGPLPAQTSGTPAGPVMPMAPPPGAGGPAQASAPAGASVAPSTYVLGPGDRVRITVYGEDRLSGEYVITSTGELSFPLIGNVRVSGISVADLQALVRTRLASGYLNDPRVTAEMLTFRPFYVLGEVARPGQYPYVDGLTVQQAIATAGGYTYRAKRSLIYLRGPQQGSEQRVDLKKEPLKTVGPGDTIRIGERFF